jgi:hypothetical protein
MEAFNLEDSFLDLARVSLSCKDNPQHTNLTGAEFSKREIKKGIVMKIKERLTQKIHLDKWEALEALEKKFDAVESGLGFPAKKRYRLILSSKSINMIVVEREWDSFADFEKAWEKWMSNPQINGLMEALNDVVEDGYTEILMPLP